jgi:hypothetical protein
MEMIGLKKNIKLMNEVKNKYLNFKYKCTHVELKLVIDATYELKSTSNNINSFSNLSNVNFNHD